MSAKKNPKLKNEYPKLTIENTGGFFDSYVLYETAEKFYIKNFAKDLPRELLKKCNHSPEHIKAVIEVVSDLEEHEEFCELLLDRGSVTHAEYTFLLSVI